MSLEQDVAAAQRALEALADACQAVTGHVGDTVDARRLRQDITRVRDDLVLIGATPPPPREIYPPVYYDDGFDQSMDAPGRRAP